MVHRGCASGDFGLALGVLETIAVSPDVQVSRCSMFELFGVLMWSRSLPWVKGLSVNGEVLKYIGFCNISKLAI